MTRCEITGVRDLTFSGWVRAKLPDSKTGFLVSDLDWILYNYKTKTLMLIEVKTRSKQLAYWQESLFKLLDVSIRNGIPKEYTYLGFSTIVFENTFFTDGKCWLDGKEVSEQELIDILSLL